eukprot:3946623-Amphidinium_carterae.1
MSKMAAAAVAASTQKGKRAMKQPMLSKVVQRAIDDNLWMLTEEELTSVKNAEGLTCLQKLTKDK